MFNFKTYEEMKTIKNLFSVVIFTFILFSCSESVIDMPTYKPDIESLDINSANEEFAKILAKAIQNEEIREFIKVKSLEQVDKDYDVIYHLVKNEKTSSNLTFREALATYSNLSVNQLDEITRPDPTLTILIPYIDSTMNANTWNTKMNSDINVVFRPYDIGMDVKTLSAYNLNGEEMSIERYEKPTNQIVVVKSNERLLATTNTTKSTNSKDALKNEDGVFAYFSDDEFNNISSRSTKVVTNGNRPDLYPSRNLSWYEKLAYAYTYGIPYQRDYVYYSLTNINSTGALDRTHAEYLHKIYLNSIASYNILVKSSDITEGALEFFLDFIFVKRDGGAYNFRKVLHLPINDVFYIQQNGELYDTVALLPNLQLFTWDLHEFGDLFKLSVSEYDNGKEVLTTHTVTSTFTENFKSEASGGFELGPIKIGWGGDSSGSNSKTETATVQIKTSENTVSLGDVYVNFYDNSFISESMIFLIDGWIGSPKLVKNNSISFDSFKKQADKGVKFSFINSNIRKYDTGTVTTEIIPLKIH